MRIMRLLNTNKKKVRGAKRKCNQMIREINESITEFPEAELKYGYWHTHLPVAQDFIDSSKTPRYIRKLCVQTLIDAVLRLIKIKPELKIPCRVVALVNLPYLWHSQIIVFFGDDYFNGFFERDNEYQKWTPFPKNRSLAKEWGLNIPEKLEERGYFEIINNEDFQSKSELWYFGELN